MLSLIAQHRLDVTEVSLAAVTDEFIAHLAGASSLDLDEATAFVVVAATLLDLKAARLLPGAGVEDEADLAVLEARDLLFVRLLQYRAFRTAADDIDQLLRGRAGAHGRHRGVDPALDGLVPELVWTTSADDLARLAALALAPKPATAVSTAHLHAPLVSLVDQRRVVEERLRGVSEVTYSDLMSDADHSGVVVARFLALLELYREAMVTFLQDTPLGEIVVRFTAAPVTTGTPS